MSEELSQNDYEDQLTHALEEMTATAIRREAERDTLWEVVKLLIGGRDATEVGKESEDSIE